MDHSVGVSFIYDMDVPPFELMNIPYSGGIMAAIFSLRTLFMAKLVRSVIILVQNAVSTLETTLSTLLHQNSLIK